MKSTPPPTRNRAWRRGLALGAATFLAYLPAWNGKPLWDDAAHLTKPALRSAAGLASIWTQLGATQQYYPLMHSTFWLEYQLWGRATMGYHLINILLHVCSALLFVEILRRLRVRGAWLAGALFALHPVMVESVAWITELKNTLSGFFFLAAALAYLDFDEKRGRRAYVAALLLFLGGLLSKSVIATLPPALLVVCWWQRGRLAWKRDVWPLLPFFLAGLAAGLFTAWVERTFIGAQGSAFDLTFVERCLIAGRALWFYLYKLVWPAELIFIYPRWHIDPTAVWQWLFPVAFVSALIGAWVIRKRSRTPLAVLLYFALTVFPALGFFNVYPFLYSFVADHFQYLAAIGPLAAAASGVVWVAERLGDRLRRPLQKSVLGAICALLFLLSWRQSCMYADAETLYRTTVRKNDGCWMAHTHLGLVLMDKGRFDEAMIHLRKALQLHPNQADAHNNLGLLLARMGRSDEAMAHFEQALAMNPDQADAHNNLGPLLARAGRSDEAMAHYQKAMALHPEHAEVYYNIAGLLADAARTDEAIAYYRKALALNPEYADAYSNLGLAFAKLGRADEAMAAFRKALEQDPEQANAHNNLGVMLAQSGRHDEAIAHYRRAVAIDPTDLDHLDNLVVALVKQGHWKDAVAILEEAHAAALRARDGARATAIGDNLAKLLAAVKAAQAAEPDGSQHPRP